MLEDNHGMYIWSVSSARSHFLLVSGMPPILRIAAGLVPQCNNPSITWRLWGLE